MTHILIYGKDALVLGKTKEGRAWRSSISEGGGMCTAGARGLSPSRLQLTPPSIRRIIGRRRWMSPTPPPILTPTQTRTITIRSSVGERKAAVIKIPLTAAFLFYNI